MEGSEEEQIFWFSVVNSGQNESKNSAAACKRFSAESEEEAARVSTMRKYDIT